MSSQPRRKGAAGRRDQPDLVRIFAAVTLGRAAPAHPQPLAKSRRKLFQAFDPVPCGASLNLWQIYPSDKSRNLRGLQVHIRQLVVWSCIESPVSPQTYFFVENGLFNSFTKSLKIRMEATEGIEPPFTDLQILYRALALRHVTRLIAVLPHFYVQKSGNLWQPAWDMSPYGLAGRAMDCRKTGHRRAID